MFMGSSDCCCCCCLLDHCTASDGYTHVCLHCSFISSAFYPYILFLLSCFSSTVRSSPDDTGHEHRTVHTSNAFITTPYGQMRRTEALPDRSFLNHYSYFTTRWEELVVGEESAIIASSGHDTWGSHSHERSGFPAHRPLASQQHEPVTKSQAAAETV